MECKKCNAPSLVTLRKKDYYCKNCFLTNTNHKFRACIGKNKILRSNEKVLICLSGGTGSTVLLDLIFYGLSMDIHKKLRIVPYFFHLIANDNSNTINVRSIIELCKKYNFDIYVAHISEYGKEWSQLPEKNSIPDVNSDLQKHFDTMLKTISPTASIDYLNKIKRSLYIRYADLLGCKFIFTGETTTSLAINLLSNFAIGRGSQVEHDNNFLDKRDDTIKILRPMKDISQEELNYYINIQQLNPIYHTDLPKNSLQSVINTFVTDLQENFQSTISTVCKTAEKIGAYEDNEKYEKCIMCKSDFNIKDIKLSGLEATNFSRTVSFMKPLDDDNKMNSSVLESLQSNHKSMFPYIYKHLCYSCSKNYSEMGQGKFPIYLQKQLDN